VRSVVTAAAEAAQLGPAPELLERAATHAGFGVAARAAVAGAAPQVYFVVVLAARR
jgi:hypothetical protein